MGFAPSFIFSHLWFLNRGFLFCRLVASMVQEGHPRGMSKHCLLGAGSTLAATVLGAQSVIAGLAVSCCLTPCSVPSRCPGLATQRCAKPAGPGGEHDSGPSDRVSEARQCPSPAPTPTQRTANRNPQAQLLITLLCSRLRIHCFQNSSLNL